MLASWTSQYNVIYLVEPTVTIGSHEIIVQSDYVLPFVLQSRSQRQLPVSVVQSGKQSDAPAACPSRKHLRREAARPPDNIKGTYLLHTYTAEMTIGTPNPLFYFKNVCFDNERLTLLA